MTRFFEKRDPWGHGLALWVLATVVFVLPPAWWMVRQFDWTVAVEQPLPKSDPDRQILSWFQSEFPDGDRLLVTWKGSSLDDPRVRRLASQLVGTTNTDGVRHNGLPEVRFAVTPRKLIKQMVENGVSQEEAIGRLVGTLVGTGTLKVRLTETGRKHSRRTKQLLSRQILEKLGLVVTITDASETAIDHEEEEPFDNASENGAEEADVEEDEPLLADRLWDFQIGWPGMAFRRMQVQKVRSLVGQFQPNGHGSRRSSSGRPVAECFLTPGSPVGLSVVLTDAGRAGGDETLRVIRQAASSVGIPPEDLSLTGRPVTNQQLSRAVGQIAWNRTSPLTHFHKRSPLLFSALVTIVLTLTFVRGFRTAILVLMTAGLSTLLTVAFLPISQGRLTTLLIAVPTVVSLITICGAVYFLSHWRAALRKNRWTAVANAVESSRRPCLFSGLTTAVALFSLLSSPLAPVRDFGLYAGMGCLISLMVVLYVLPSLLQFLPIPVEDSDHLSSAEETVDGHSAGESRIGDGSGGGLWAADLAMRFRIPTMVCCLLLLAVGLFGLKFLHSDVAVTRLFSPSTRLLQDAVFQEEQLSGVLPVEMVVRFDGEAREHLSFLERMELIRRIEGDLRRHPAVSGAFSLADLQPISPPPPSARAGLLRKARYKRGSHAVEVRLIGNRNPTVSSLQSVAQNSAELQIAPGYRMFIRQGDELWRITARVTQQFDTATVTAGGHAPRKAISDEFNAIVRSVLKTHPGADHVMTGPVLLQLREQQAVQESLLLSFGITTAVATLLLMVLLANPLAGLLTMLSVLFPIGMVLGVLSWCGEPVGLGMLVAVAFSIGMAVNAALHVVIRFQTNLKDDVSRRDALAETLGHCVPAIWETGVIVGMGVLLLCATDLLIVQRFGWIMASLTAVTLLAETILLPALLAGPLGALIDGAIRRGRSDALELEQAEMASHDRRDDGSQEIAAPHWSSMPSSTSARSPKSLD